MLTPAMLQHSNDDTSVSALRVSCLEGVSTTDPTPAVAKSLVFQAAILLLLPGVVAIVGRVSGRGTIAVVSGGTVYGAGLVGGVHVPGVERRASGAGRQRPNRRGVGFGG
jgi:hypothetical protein